MNKNIILILLMSSFLNVHAAKRGVESEEYFSPLTPEPMCVRFFLAIASCFCCGCYSRDEDRFDFDEEGVNRRSSVVLASDGFPEGRFVGEK